VVLSVYNYSYTVLSLLHMWIYEYNYHLTNMHELYCQLVLL